ncbi:hypothetical protein E3E12_01350 [Formicincola oecophyllae]|uniref:Uncharacterized protein n=1 Tax=Formicincola oecophyllae TaxID=2558361 RepID=A0A4Y6U7B9_9PROT|nr:hypothetical protein [Formicincola oecophyllae]QDH13064.2 hypothetical protein E3E12_01350 [Formicincola oecophyllae]
MINSAAHPTFLPTPPKSWLGRHPFNRAAVLAMVGLLLAACGGDYYATPIFADGHWYMAGDANCVHWTASPNHITCTNAQGKVDGIRLPMSKAALDQMMWEDYLVEGGPY